MFEERLQRGGWRWGSRERKDGLRQVSSGAGPAAGQGMVEETRRQPTDPRTTAGTGFVLRCQTPGADAEEDSTPQHLGAHERPGRCSGARGALGRAAQDGALGSNPGGSPAALPSSPGASPRKAFLPYARSSFSKASCASFSTILTSL